mmetsp:Transcript_2700/g.6273  ORF Transcript_2700/g.6273 Transcript_2700/m.6273 type:complete len:345 (-) Transcript_2700:139-1173(-)
MTARRHALVALAVFVGTCAATCAAGVAPVVGEPPLTLVHEEKLYRLIPGVASGDRVEASGVAAVNGTYYIVADNDAANVYYVRNFVDKNAAENGVAAITGHDVAARFDGYEGIAYDAVARHFFLLVESSATLRASVVRTDARFNVLSVAEVDFALGSANKGFESVQAVRIDGALHLVLLCEGNACAAGDEGRARGHGRMVLVEHAVDARGGDAWRVVRTVDLPAAAFFEDYSALLLHAASGTLLVASQVDSAVFAASYDTATMAVSDADGAVYVLPRVDGHAQYCNVEGLALRDDAAGVLLVAVSDKAKHDDAAVCAEHGESVALFTAPRSLNTSPAVADAGGG